MAATCWRYPRIIAHRCGGALAPENSLAGMFIAARLGILAVEFDVMLSADGVPLLIHDETLERTTDGEGPVAEKTAARLLALDAGVRHHRAFAGERLPTFRDALETCLKLGLSANVEIKPAVGHEVQTGLAVAQSVREFLADCADAQRLPLLFSSFSESALDAARIDVSIAGAPARALLFEKVPGDWPDRLRRLDCHSLHCAAATLQPEQLAEIRAAGLPLACYTVNRAEEAERLFAAGVTAIFSDRLDLFAGKDQGPRQAGLGQVFRDG